MLNIFAGKDSRLRFSIWLLAAIIGGTAAGCSEAVVEAPPATVTFENSMFRILDMNLPAGTTLEHTYERPAATIVMLEGSRYRTHLPGEDWGEETNATLGAAHVGEAGAHGVQNRGEAPLQLLAIENLGEGGGAKAEPVSGPGVMLTAESEHFGVYDVQMADTNFQVSHTHTVPVVMVLASGRILSQGAEIKDDPAIGAAPTGLKQLDQAGQWVLIPPNQMHFVVRLGAEPSHVVEVELR